MPFDYRTIGIARKIAYRKGSTSFAFFEFFRWWRKVQEFAIRSGLSGSAELGDSKIRKADPLGEKPLHHSPARLGLDRRAMRGSGQRNSTKMARKLPQN
jgi:hypothetical protein